MLSTDFREFVALLNAHDVKYMIVGGYAVGFHGHPRYTGDLDIWIEATPGNAEKVVNALDAFGFGGLDITVDDLCEADNVIQLGYPPERIDILTSIDGVGFSEAFPHVVIADINGLSVPVIGREALLRNKRASGRARDQDDLDNLMTTTD